MAHFKWKVSGRGYEAANLFDEKLEEKRNSGDTEIGDDISSIKQVEKMEKRNEAIWYSCAPTRRLSGSIRFTDSPSDMDKQTSEKNNVSLPVMMTLFIAGEDLLRLLEKIDADRKCDISCAFSELNSNQNKNLTCRRELENNSEMA